LKLPPGPVRTIQIFDGIEALRLLNTISGVAGGGK